MSLKEKFAQKMLEEKLDFLPLKESLELLNSGEVVETKFGWVINTEELDTDEKETYEMTKEELLESYDEVFGLDNNCGLKIGDYDTFSEFTLELCPAPTYIDLIK